MQPVVVSGNLIAMHPRCPNDESCGPVKVVLHAHLPETNEHVALAQIVNVPVSAVQSG